MKISYNWLKQYINCNLPAEEVAEALTFTGLEVEDIIPYESVKGSLKGIVVGEVLSCIEHPNSDHLHITKVNVGGEEPLPIVCGAPNVAQGQKVLVATIGTTLYSGDESFQIKKSKIRGEVSEGMICSEKELGLGDSHAGIMVLPETCEVGQPASKYFPVEQDFTFEIGLTANRSDATSHIGVARDLVAVLNHRLHNDHYSLTFPSVDNFKIENTNCNIEVEVLAKDACPRYSGVTISGIQVGASPAWLKNRLQAAGIRSINNVVDITNYVLLEVGQPLHAFDVETIKGGKIVVRTCAKDTPFVTLDGIERKLNENDLMICNSENPMCIAGVFGGLGSGVTESTTSVFIESAYFDPRSVRKTAKRHALQTDASFRFERGADPEITIYAMKRAALLIKELAGGKISSEIKDVVNKEFVPADITLDFAYLNKIAGQSIPKNDAKSILTNLGCRILSDLTDTIVVQVPTYKVDVYRPADLVEEILRIYGYNNINIPSKINVSINVSEEPNFDKIQHHIADMLSANGFYEIMNNSLTKSSYSKTFSEIEEKNNVHMLNPLSSDLDVLRQTLIFGGLESVAYNQNRKITDMKLYEFGNVYTFNPEAVQTNEKPLAPYRENYHLDLFITGNKEEELWNHGTKAVDFYDMKYYVEAVFNKLKINMEKVEITEGTSAFYDFSLIYSFDNKVIGTIGKFTKQTLKTFDIKKDVYHASLNWDTLMKLYTKVKTLHYEAVSKFPSVRRDLALVIDKNVSFSSIKAVALKAESNLLQSVSIFDIYEGDKIPQGKKSYAISFILEDKQKTLTDKVIEKTMQKIQTAIEQQLGATLR